MRNFNQDFNSKINNEELETDCLMHLSTTPADACVADKKIDFSLRNKNVLLFGFGISGQGAYALLKQFGANIFLCANNLSNFSNEDLSVKLLKKVTSKIIKGMDLIILSPTTQLSRKCVKTVKANQIECIGEIEFAYRYCNADVLAVTGTNGKTTTATLLNDMVATTYGTHLLGNIGKSFAGEVLTINEGEKVILECSSFQLAQTKMFCPHVACLLNLAPDHLDIHKDLSEYYNAKLKIFANMTSADFAVINFDDNTCYELTKGLQAQTYYFSLKQECKGVFLKDETIFFSDGIITYTIERLENIKYIGAHNLCNIMCAICMAILSGVSIENILDVLKNFHLPPHRLEFVRKYKGVEYYNDSKATNISSCVEGCKSFKKNIHLLLGGSDKGEDFKNFASQLPDNVKVIYLFGKIQRKLYKILKKQHLFEVYKCETLASATRFSALKAQQEEVVLLSPACASFDSYKNFEERGNSFKSIVNNLNN